MARPDRGPLLSSVVLVGLATVATLLLVLIGVNAVKSPVTRTGNTHPTDDGGPSHISVPTVSTAPSVKPTTAPVAGPTTDSPTVRRRTSGTSTESGTATTAPTTTAPTTSAPTTRPPTTTAPTTQPSPSPSPTCTRGKGACKKATARAGGSDGAVTYGGSAPTVEPAASPRGRSPDHARAQRVSRSADRERGSRRH